ncbi:prepilin peptidase [Sphingorhabdus sp. SMR4y]|uniref:A24 family peptidase n=1 Tax=Sphingorhabdus sp. SMR4y TaxID=2584094 RepID=UPI000B5C7D45|nr:prepilin peptidase [Sphingorhabdus sp. SMR4y]ASK86849.1 type IV leader peptidase family protein [Sphingorhabdus sp. SMR4y]
MDSETFIYLLWGGLAIALIVAAITDIKSRHISNWLNLGIALGAPVYWISSGMSLWPEMIGQIGLAAVIFTIFAAMFAVGAMGGGDVKLLTALSLWMPWLTFLELLVIMSIAGGLLTLLMMIGKTIQKTEGPLKVPYGVAIAFSGLWMIWGITGHSSQTIF